MIDTLALSPEGHQHEQQASSQVGMGEAGMICFVGRGKKIRSPLKVLGTVPFGLFTLTICKIRQVVFTTFLNWLLKTLLKRT
jgi:hypothetical protein